jgi:prepilin-type N-terminal cleavage/methylation domain-containing protein
MMHRARVRGFTLVELMVVVVILGVLAVLALFAYRKYTYAARNSEAVQFLGAVRAAQESYFQSFGQYCGTLQPALHPAAIPFEAKETWNPPANSPWRDLSIQSAGRVWFQYYLVAGTANQNPPADAPFLPAEVNGRPWYWAGACGDFNGDGAGQACSGALSNDRMASKLSFFETSSVRADVVTHHEGQ